MKICGKEIRVEGRLLRVARLDADKYYFLDDPETVIEGVRNSGVRVDLFTFVQKLPETTPRYQYPMEWDNFAALPIHTFEEWWTKQLGFKARNKAKQAEKKGIVIREVPFDEVLIRGIWEIYNEYPIRQGRKFLHYGKDIDTVRREEATYLENSQFIGAFDGEKLIGFVKIVVDESGTQAGLMNILSMIEYRDKAPTNALVAHAVRYCASRCISHLAYSSFAYGKKERSSISDFKERNGFEKFEVPRYYVPFNSIGWSALRLGLHKRLADHLPDSVLHPIRKLRATWYGRRFQAINESA